MCGIGGILRKRGGLNEKELYPVAAAIAHRGPDGTGYWINSDQTLGLVHLRLSIIDLSERASQPMHSADGRYTIIFNGEIYNYIELKEQFLKEGRTFRSESDTEVLLMLFDKYREKCLSMLDGMFAFTIWDRKESKLFAARDRFGEKPFYYSLSSGQFVFCSEMKGLWAAGIQKKVKPPMLYYYLVHDRVLDPGDAGATFYESIRQLPAGHFAWVNANLEIAEKKYWSVFDLGQGPDPGEKAAAEKIHDLLLTSVKRRLRSDVPVGSSLSGGIDSSSIVMMIDSLKTGNQVQNTFSARFRDFYKDEGKFIDLVLSRCSAKPHMTWISAADVEKEFEAVCHAQEEPFVSASIIAQWFVMKLARENKVTVLLDGQGADEVFAGYIFYYHIYLNQLFKSGNGIAEKELGAFNAMHGAGFPYRKPQPQSGGKETLRMKLGRIRRQVTGSGMPDPEKEIFTDEFYRYIRNEQLKQGSYDQLDQALKNSTAHYGMNTLLRYADRNSMAHSREVRLPFLFHELVEYAFRLPDHYKLNNGWTKYILRKAVEPVLPDEICWRKDKVGYEPPQDEWLRASFFNEMKEQGAEALLRNKIIRENSAGIISDWKLIMSARYLS